MTALYRIDRSRSQFSVQAFATGMLSAFGHSPTFAVRDFAGTVRLDGADLRDMGLELTVNAGSLELRDQVGPADRAEIERRMRGEVLETRAYPEITYRATEVAADPVDRGHFRLFIGGLLSLHGVTRPHGVDEELLIYGDGLRLRGGCPLRMSDFRIRPVTALGGAIKLKDEVKVSFDLVALPEVPSGN